MRAYCVSKGLANTAIRPVTYEHAPQHIIEQNTPTAGNQHLLTRQAFAEILRDPRMGALAVEQIERYADAGADLCFFGLADKATAAIMIYGSWGAMDSVGEFADEPYASIAAYLANPTQRPKSRTIKGVLS